MSEKILIVDNSHKNTELLKLIFTNYSKYSVEVESDYDNIVKNYSNDKYTFIIFDHSCEIADNLINHVLSENTAQKCILLSDSINCPVSCEICLNSFKFVRLLKPLNPKDILYYIDEKNEYICPNKYIFDSIDTLDKLYKFLNIENNVYYRTKELQDDKILIKAISQTNIKIDELEKIQENVNSKYFNFKIMQDNTIKISKL